MYNVLSSCICMMRWQRSVTGGLGSIQAEIMADTAVALASANVQLVSKKVIWRLCRVRNLFHRRFLRFDVFMRWKVCVSRQTSVTSGTVCLRTQTLHHFQVLFGRLIGWIGFELLDFQIWFLDSACKSKSRWFISRFYAIRKSPQNRSTIPPCSLDPMPLPTIRRF